VGWTEQDEGRGVARRTSIGACALMRVVVLLFAAVYVDVGWVWRRPVYPSLRRIWFREEPLWEICGN
jgi:hypothetical protein